MTGNCHWMSRHQNSPFSIFDYSRTQQWGLLLVGLLIFISGALQFWSPFSPPEVDFSEDWLAHAATYQDATRPQQAESFYFDPNTVSKEELIRLGLKPAVANSWLKYRGNRKRAFRKAEDILKLYRLDSVDGARLLPLVRINQQSSETAFSTNEVARSERTQSSNKKTIASFPFDPNTVSQFELEQLGLSPKQAKAFLNYRSKVKFTHPDQLDRIRVLRPENLEHLKPLVEITTANPPIADATPATPAPTHYNSSIATPQPYEPKEEVALSSIDINTASAEVFQTLRGIGPTRSKRITNFREKLGGFYAIDQVGATYGVPDSVFQAIKPYLTLETKVFRQLKINTMSAEELAGHPYISRKLATALIKYKANNGPFRSAEDLAKVRILKAADRKKLLPYIDFTE